MRRALEIIARERIDRAVDRGEFRGLPGEGKPIDFSEEALVPKDQRMAYRVLKNAGMVPQGLRTRMQIQTLELRLQTVECEHTRAELVAQIALLRTMLERD